MTVKKANTKKKPGREILKKIIDRDEGRRAHTSRAIKAALDGRPPFKPGRGGAREGAGRKKGDPTRSVKLSEALVLDAATEATLKLLTIREVIEKWAKTGRIFENAPKGKRKEVNPEDQIIAVLDIIEENINKPSPFFGLLSATTNERNLCHENQNPLRY